MQKTVSTQGYKNNGCFNKAPKSQHGFERFGGIITVKKLLVANFDSYIHWVFSFRFGELRYTYHRIVVAANIWKPPDDT